MNKAKQALIYKIAIFIVALIYIITPTYGGSSIGSKLLINAIGIDGGEQMTVTIESVGRQSEGIVGKGDDIRLAINEINSKKGQYTEISHCGLVVLGADISTDEALASLLGLLSEGKINSGISVLAASTSAEEFISSAVSLSSAGGMSAISKYVTYLENYLNIGSLKLINFVSKLRSPSAVASLPIISIEDIKGVLGEPSKSSDSSSSAENTSDDPARKEIKLEYTGRIFGSSELYLPSAPNRIYDLLVNNRGTGIATLSNFTYDGVDYGTISGNIVTKDAKVSLQSPASATLDISLRLNLTNRNKIVALLIEKGVPASDIYAEIIEQFQEKYTDYANQLVEFTKEYDVDLLGLQTQLSKYFPKAEYVCEEMVVGVGVPQISVY